MAIVMRYIRNTAHEHRFKAVAAYSLKYRRATALPYTGIAHPSLLTRHIKYLVLLTVSSSNISNHKTHDRPTHPAYAGNIMESN